MDIVLDDALSTYGSKRKGECWNFNGGLAIVNLSDGVFTLYFENGINPKDIIGEPYELYYIKEIDGYRVCGYGMYSKLHEVLRKYGLKPISKVEELSFLSPNLWTFDETILKYKN